MDICTVSLFGHRELSQPFMTEERLERVISHLITHKDFTEFLIGRDGEFDILAASVIKRSAEKYDYGNCSMTLVLPYMKAEYRKNQKHFLEYYDEVEICSESSSAYFKAAIQIRNKHMIDRSNLVICYAERKSGGAYGALKYALDSKKPVINLAEPDLTETSGIEYLST